MAVANVLTQAGLGCCLQVVTRVRVHAPVLCRLPADIILGAHSAVKG